jgi:hypothetical protein
MYLEKSKWDTISNGGSDIEYLEHGISFFSRTEISNLYLVMDKVSYELIDG